MALALELYLDQCERWPTRGRHILAQYDDHRPGSTWCLGIEDVTELVLAQRVHVRGHRFAELATPCERVYAVDDPAVVSWLGLAPRPDA